MIEGFRLAPVIFAMAGSAILSQISLVCIITLMAIDAATRRLAEGPSSRVATRTWHGFVGTIEQKIREGVIEGRFVQ